MNTEITGFKVIKWFNKNTMAIQYGVDAQIGGKWYHLTDDEGPYIYNTEREARKKLKELAIEQGVL